MSHREYRTRMAYLEDQLNEPDRSDYYLMQIAGHVAHVMSKKRWKLDDFKVRFKTQRSKSGRTVEEITASSKAVWALRAARSMEGNHGN